MSNDSINALRATWAAKDLPARLDAMETAKLLGFAEHDIQVLMAARKLVPLGDPAPNAPKWFSAIEIIRLATDRDWLNKATKEVSKYWRHKRERRGNLRRSPRQGQIALSNHEKLSPKSSPDPSLNGQWNGNEGAMTSSERAVPKSA